MKKWSIQSCRAWVLHAGTATAMQVCCPPLTLKGPKDLVLIYTMVPCSSDKARHHNMLCLLCLHRSARNCIDLPGCKDAYIRSARLMLPHHRGLTERTLIEVEDEELPLQLSTTPRDCAGMPLESVYEMLRVAEVMLAQFRTTVTLATVLASSGSIGTIASGGSPPAAARVRTGCGTAQEGQGHRA